MTTLRNHCLFDCASSSQMTLFCIVFKVHVLSLASQLGYNITVCFFCQAIFCKLFQCFLKVNRPQTLCFIGRSSTNVFDALPSIVRLSFSGLKSEVAVRFHLQLAFYRAHEYLCSMACNTQVDESSHCSGHFLSDGCT